MEYVIPVYEPTIKDYRRDKKRDIERYDSSKNINIFYINDIPAWIRRHART